MAVVGTEDQLAWEARQRNGAAIAAAVSGVCTFAGTAWRGLALDLPRNGLAESVGRAAEPGPIGGLESLHVDTVEGVHHNPAAVVA